jgi:hypothetical protein
MFTLLLALRYAIFAIFFTAGETDAYAACGMHISVEHTCDEFSQVFVAKRIFHDQPHAT